MKLSRHAFVRFWDVHAWTGVLAGLVLHVMFFAGAFSLFLAELTSWQEPAAPAPHAQNVRLGPLVARTLHQHGVDPPDLALSLPGHRGRFLEVSWPQPGRPDWANVRLDPVSGAVVPETSRLARILFYLHFLYHPRAAWGMYVAGFLAVALLVALVTGVLIHLKAIARQFHQFRPTHTVKVLWSDLHKVFGVMGLPFQLTIAFTGAFISLAGLLVLVFSGPIFGGDDAAATTSLWGGARNGVATGRAATPLPIDDLLAAVRRHAPGFRPTFMRLSHRGDAAAIATLSGDEPGTLFRRGELVLRASDGALLSPSGASPTPGVAVTRWMTGLHYALFGGLATKLAYAVLAAASCLTILSGNWIWLLRRQARAHSPGNRLLARLTIGVGGGVVLATGALFWANRLAPPPIRMAAESWAFFGVWAAAVVLHLVRAGSRSGWVGMLRLAGAGFVLLPLASFVTTDAHLFNLGEHGRREIAGVEGGLVTFGALLLLCAAVLKRRAACAADRAARQQPGRVCAA